MDVLQEHLIRARASGGVFARSVAVAPWGLRLPGTIQLAVHAVVQGRAWLWTERNDDPLELTPGDLALVRGGPDHFVAHEPGAHCVPPAEFRALHADDAASPGTAAPYSSAGLTASRATSAGGSWRRYRRCCH